MSRRTHSLLQNVTELHGMLAQKCTQAEFVNYLLQKGRGELGLCLPGLLVLVLEFADSHVHLLRMLCELIIQERTHAILALIPIDPYSHAYRCSPSTPDGSVDRYGILEHMRVHYPSLARSIINISNECETLKKALSFMDSKTNMINSRCDLSSFVHSTKNQLLSFINMVMNCWTNPDAVWIEPYQDTLLTRAALSDIRSQAQRTCSRVLQQASPELIGNVQGLAELFDSRTWVIIDDAIERQSTIASD